MLNLIGKKIKDIRLMTTLDKTLEGWEDDKSNITIIILEDNTKLYASKDSEGNGPGELFGNTNGQRFML